MTIVSTCVMNMVVVDEFSVVVTICYAGFSIVERLAKETCYRVDYFIHIFCKNVGRPFKIDKLSIGNGFGQY